MIPFHALAGIFPLMEGDPFAELVEDVRVNGLRDPILIHAGEILDGRNRYRALLALRDAGVPRGPGWGIYEGDPIGDDDLVDAPELTWFQRYSPMIYGDPLDFVISRNLKRRHLNDDQRRMVAARLANMGRGRPSENLAECEIKIAEAARLVNADEAGTARARMVLAKASPEIQRAVDRGKLSVASAAQASRLEEGTQRRIAEEAEAGRANVVRTVIKQEARAVRERQIGERQIAAPEGKYGVIVEDFEWDFEPRNRETGMDRHAGNHYEISAEAHTPEEIVARTKDRFACADEECCVLWMWTTAPHLAIGIDVLRLRGFKYVTNYVWRKDRIITGWCARFRHEHLLIGVMGNPPCPAPGTQWESVIDGILGEHSAKPECFLEMIEQYFPTMLKIELNRRGPARKGWAAWGNEAQPGEFDSETGEVLPTAEAMRIVAEDGEPASVAPAAAADAGSNSLDIPACLLRPAPSDRLLLPRDEEIAP